jgi:AraC family transcriptional regulator of adaptative response / DNA-3-methyladenine glycosylase II
LRLFPTPETIAEAEIERIGLTRARAHALRQLAAAVARRDLVLDGTRDPAETRAALLALPGIGPWTAEYIALRALREPDAFPAGDLGLRRAFAAARTKRRTPSGRALAEPALARAAEAWRPWRAYAAIHLWTWEARRAAPSR